MERVSIALQVPAYLKKVLDKKFGEDYEAKENNWFGILILNILIRKSDRYYELKKPTGATEFTFTISHKKAKYKGFAVSEMKIRSIIRSIESNFRDEMYYMAIFNNIHYDIDYKTTILDVLESYDIEEEDLSYESIRKDFNRNKARILKKITEKSVKKIQ